MSQSALPQPQPERAPPAPRVVPSAAALARAASQGTPPAAPAPTALNRPAAHGTVAAPATAMAAATAAAAANSATEAPAAKTAAKAADRGEPTSLITPARVGFLLAAIVIALGYQFPTQRYITPESGLGYALGIVGGSLMLLLLLYPARKHLPITRFMGSVKAWFQTHMILGVIGPILILFHSNFSLGATNSNAALFAMLVVAGSGIFGRYFYTRIHFGLYGRRASRTDMQAAADDLKAKVSGSRFVPELLQMLDDAEVRMLLWKHGKGWLVVRPAFVTGRMYYERWRITRRATAELSAAAAQSPALREQHEMFAKAVRRYISRRLESTRRVAEFESYERLFSLWHVLHLPLFFLLMIAGIVHVIAVHVY
jgi:hypothetical protein